MTNPSERDDNEGLKFDEVNGKIVVRTKSTFSINITEERMEYNAQGMIIYQGWAIVGAAEDAAVWLISKLIYSGYNATERRWADGTALFDKKWTLRDSYSYSY